MFINNNQRLAPYDPITNPQTPKNHRGDNQHRSSYQDTVTISDQARKIADADAARFQEPPSASSLAHGDLIYVGPPGMSLEEARQRMDLWDKYQHSPFMKSFRKDAIRFYEREITRGTDDQEIGRNLMAMYEEMHKKLAALNSGQTIV